MSACGRPCCGHDALAHDPQHGCDDAECPCTGYMPPQGELVRARGMQLTQRGLQATEHVAARVRAERSAS